MLHDRIMGSPARTDRILVGACAAVWLVLLGISVAAVVALVDLGRGFQPGARESHTGVLYGIIIVSALIIVASIPVLLHARQTPPRPPVRRPNAPARVRVDSGLGDSGEGSGAEGEDGGKGAAVPKEEVDRIWLRGTAGLVGAFGAAWIPVAEATYLMAVGKDGAAWIGYCFAALIAMAMPVIPWFFLRQLRDLFAHYRG
jgi:hypothetical protein